MKHFLSFLALLGFVGWFALAEQNPPTTTPVEIGSVRWLRDLDQAFVQAKQKQKPVLILFQEVPGCVGCQQFGKQVLSHPLVVEAMEQLFVPVVVYNNRPGKDAEILKRYQEPAWNFQVIRFFNHVGKEIIPRKDRVWTTGAIARRMVQALSKTKQAIPAYLQGLSWEADNPQLQEAYFAMHCFWVGEAKLGAIPGVIQTEAGWINHREVTKVKYDPRQISLADLVQQAAKIRCAQTVYLNKDQELAIIRALPQFKLKTVKLKVGQYSPAKRSDQKKQLEKSPFRQLKLTDYQLTKINAYYPTNLPKALTFLSSRQLEQFKKWKKQ